MPPKVSAVSAAARCPFHASSDLCRGAGEKCLSMLLDAEVPSPC